MQRLFSGWVWLFLLLPALAFSQTTTFSGSEHLGNPTDSSVTINIVPDNDINVFFQYSTTQGGPYTDTGILTAEAGEAHEIIIDGLAANTRYYYRMQYQLPDQAWIVRDEYTFHTQRTEGASFQFAITADSHINIGGLGVLSQWKNTLSLIAADTPDFLIDLGDTFDMDEVTTAEQAEDVYLYQRDPDIMGRVSHSSPIFLAMGNHENEEGWNFDDTNPQPVFGMNARKQFFPLPTPGPFYSGNSDVSETRVSGDHLRENYYAWEWGDVLFVIFDPYQYTMVNPYGAIAGEGNDEIVSGDRWNWTLGSQQYAWLKDTLESSDAKFKLLFAHQMLGGTENYVRGGAEGASWFEWGGYNVNSNNIYPEWEFNSHRSQEEGWETPIHQLMIDNNVNAFFHGHDHHFVHEERDNIVYQLVPAASQGTGQGFNNYSTSNYVIENLGNSGYLRASVFDTEILVEYVKSTGPNAGEVEYSYSIDPRVDGGAGGNVRPLLEVTHSSDNMTVSDIVDMTEVQGRAVDDSGISAVHYRVNSGPTLIATGTGSWSLNTALATGNNRIEIWAEDDNGLASETATITVYRSEPQPDLQPPMLTVPAPLDIILDTGNVLSSTDSRIVNFLNTASATDDTDGAVPVLNDAPDEFPLGEVNIVFTATDNAGNTASVEVPVTVTSLDNDSDGIPNTIEITYGLDIDNPADAQEDLDSDGKNNLEEYQQDMILNEDDVPPDLTPPPDITVLSTGPYTLVDPGIAIASDYRDGMIIPVADNPGPFAPGHHELTWTAQDLSGNTSNAQQSVNLIPQINFGPSQTIAEGSDAIVQIILNGSAVNYPVTLLYSVSGTASHPEDHTLTAGEISIASGKTAEINLTAIEDNLMEANESIIIHMEEAINASLGNIREHQITLTDGNLPPDVEIVMFQGGSPISSIVTDGGVVTLTALISDPNAGDEHTVLWTTENSAINPIQGFSQPEFSFDPASMPESITSVNVTVTDNGEGMLSGTDQRLFKVLTGRPLLEANQDSDGDGINDQSEGYTDSDGDRLPDYLDVPLASNMLAAGESLLETEPGLTVRLGAAAYVAGSPGASVTIEDINNYVSSVGGLVNADQDHAFPAGIFDFEIQGVETGSAARIVLPLQAGVPENAIYRKFSPDVGWNPLVTDNADNAVYSAPGSPGVCPSPGDTSYIQGLNPGDYCVQLLIEDGGPNDADSNADGTISDPGGVSVISLNPPEITVESNALTTPVFRAGDGEQVVFSFSISADSDDAEIQSLTIAANGELNEIEDISTVRLYRDVNENGIAEGSERLLSESYENDNESLIFVWTEPYRLPAAKAHFLITYQF